MSYEPTNWKDGDLVTSAKLNKIEQGISENSGSSILRANMIIEEGGMRLDKTFKEIRDTMKDGIPAYVFLNTEGHVAMMPIFTVTDPEEDEPGTINLIEGAMYAQTENDYPSTNPPNDDEESGSGGSWSQYPDNPNGPTPLA